MKSEIKERINKLITAARESCLKLGNEIESKFDFHRKYEDDKVVLESYFRLGGCRRYVVSLKFKNEQKVVLDASAGDPFKEKEIEVYHPGNWENYLIKNLQEKIQEIENRKIEEAERLLKAKFTPIDDSELFGDETDVS